MSAQSTKKKRFGSRRRAANQNEKPKADEFEITDSTFIAQPHIPEENTESLNEFASAENVQSEAQPSPELSGNRRKLGSSRRHKRPHVKDSQHDPGEEVEEKIRGKETIETNQMSLTIQPKSQEELSQGTEDDMSATHGVHLYSATSRYYSSEIQNLTTNYAEADLESLIPKSENLHADLDENESSSEVVSDSCIAEEYVQEGNDKSNTLHSEDIRQSAHLVGISELTSSDVFSCQKVDQQLIDQSNTSKMPDEKLSDVDSVTEKDDDTDLSKQDGNLQGNYIVSESHGDSVSMQFYITPEITTEKISPRKNTVGQATISSPKEELPTDEEQNEHFSFSEDRGTPQSEDAMNKVHKQEIKPTEMHEISPDSNIHDATENSEFISGNLVDQTEMSDTHQSLLILKVDDDSPTYQELSSSDSKSHERPTKENFQALEQNNEDCHVYEFKEPPISSKDRVNTALGQVSELGGRVEDDVKPAEQTGHQEKEGLLSDMEESESSLQTLQSEINVPFDSQHQQNYTDFHPLGNRRKLGLSRKNKGRRHVKDSAAESNQESTEDFVGNTKNHEFLQLTEMTLTTEIAVQEEINETMLEGKDKFDTAQTEDVSDQVHENANVATLVGSDLHASSTVDQQMIKESNFWEIPDEELPNVSSAPEKESKEREEDTELLRQDENVQTNYLVSEDIESSVASEITTDKHNPREQTEPESSVEREISSSTKQELPTNEEQNEIFHLSEDKGDHKSEDTVNALHKEEIKPAQMQEMPQIHCSPESVKHEATENSEIIFGNLTDQTEVNDTHQSLLIVKINDDSPTNQEPSSPDSKLDDHTPKEHNSEVLEQKK
ncbi:uncharacterized protein LOC121958831 [Plectropomus leopardus]|uniref:uncharacterized protein LOC121958831 n=1 Tax=Plectropomus leopardus TaxID=160734 RepID=UPI001C4B650B|nr:uncharacterized protein LOC121958831 [Plectropomus leopardus]